MKCSPAKPVDQTRSKDLRVLWQSSYTYIFLLTNWFIPLLYIHCHLSLFTLRKESTYTGVTRLFVSLCVWEVCSLPRDPTVVRLVASQTLMCGNPQSRHKTWTSHTEGYKFALTHMSFDQLAQHRHTLKLQSDCCKFSNKGRVRKNSKGHGQHVHGWVTDTKKGCNDPYSNSSQSGFSILYFSTALTLSYNSRAGLYSGF